MKFTLSLTPRLIMICAVCLTMLVTLLVMLGFELGRRWEYSENEAQATSRGEAKSAVSYSPVVLPSASSVLYNATAQGNTK